MTVLQSGRTIDNDNVLYYLISKYSRQEIIIFYISENLPKEQMPVGYKIPNKLKDILKDSGIVEEDEELEVAYLIDDSKLEGDDDKLFYGSDSSEEKHYITNTGDVIVLPGLKIVERDGTEKYYITYDCYYTLEKGEKPITLTETYGIDEIGNVIR
jgi:hypothetical protein